MPSDLRTRIETVLTDNDGLCLDDLEEREQLADQLVAAFTDLDLYLVARVHGGRIDDVQVFVDQAEAAQALMEME